jgi:hypothetical protein
MSLPDYVRKGKLFRAVVDSASFLFGGKAATIPYTNAGAPVNGTSGTLAGVAAKGSLLIDTTNAVLYQNTNTLASPTWTALTTATGAGTYTGTFDGVVGGTTPAAVTATTVTSTGINTKSVANALTASTTQTRAGGTALTKEINRVTVAANSGDAVTLPALAPGQSAEVYNDGANPISVFPNGASGAIDGGSGGAAVTLTNAKRAKFTCVATNTIISAQLGVVSA